MIEYILLFILGLIVGSFLSVIVYRETTDDKSLKSFLPKWVTGRSYCDHCKKKIAWYDNIPLLSYILLGGKCRYCKKKINISYPLFEIFTALEFVWIYWLLGNFSFFNQMEGLFSFGVLFYWIFIFSLSVTLAVIDIKKQILPDSLILAGIMVSILRLFVTGRWEFILGGIGLGVFYLLIYGLAILTFKKEGIGLGDVKLAVLIGLALGWWQWIIVATLVSFLTGSLVGIILIILGKKNMQSAIAFGPFMLLGMLVAKLFGETLWGSYMLTLGF